MKIESGDYLYILPYMRSNDHVSHQFHDELSKLVDVSEGIDDMGKLPMVIIFRPTGRPDDEFVEIILDFVEERRHRYRDKILITALSASKRGQVFTPKVYSHAFKAIWTICVSSGSLDISASRTAIENLASLFMTDYRFKPKRKESPKAAREERIFTSHSDKFRSPGYSQRKRESDKMDNTHISLKMQRTSLDTTNITSGDCKSQNTQRISDSQSAQDVRMVDDSDTLFKPAFPGLAEETHEYVQEDTPQQTVEDTPQEHLHTSQSEETGFSWFSKLTGYFIQRDEPEAARSAPTERTEASPQPSPTLPQPSTSSPQPSPSPPQTLKDSSSESDEHSEKITRKSSQLGYLFQQETTENISESDALSERKEKTLQSSNFHRPTAQQETDNVNSRNTQGISGTQNIDDGGRIMRRDLFSKPVITDQPQREYDDSVGYQTMDSHLPHYHKPHAGIVTEQPRRDYGNVSPGVMSSQAECGVQTLSAHPTEISGKDGNDWSNTSGTATLITASSMTNRGFTFQVERRGTEGSYQHASLNQGQQTGQSTSRSEISGRKEDPDFITYYDKSRSRIPRPVSQHQRNTTTQNQAQSSGSMFDSRGTVSSTLPRMDTAEVETRIKDHELLQEALEDMEKGLDLIQGAVESKFNIIPGNLPRIIRTTLEEVKIPFKVKPSASITDFLQPQIKKKIEEQFRLHRVSLKDIIKKTLKVQELKIEDEENRGILKEAVTYMEMGKNEIQTNLESKHSIRPGYLPRILTAILGEAEKRPTVPVTSDAKDFLPSTVQTQIENMFRLRRGSVPNIVQETMKQYLKLQTPKVKRDYDRGVLQESLGQMENGDETTQKVVESKCNLIPGQLPRILRTILADLEQKNAGAGSSAPPCARKRIELKLSQASVEDTVETYVKIHLKREAIKKENEQKDRELLEALKDAICQMENGDESIQRRVEKKHNVRPGHLPRILNSAKEELEKRYLADGTSDAIHTPQSSVQQVIEEQFGLSTGSLRDIIAAVIIKSSSKKKRCTIQ